MQRLRCCSGLDLEKITTEVLPKLETTLTIVANILPSFTASIEGRDMKNTLKLVSFISGKRLRFARTMADRNLMVIMYQVDNEFFVTTLEIC